MKQRLHAALLSVLALILGSGALVLTAAGTASADLAGTVTLTPSTGNVTDAQPFTQVSVSAPCPAGYQDLLNVSVAIPDLADSGVATFGTLYLNLAGHLPTAPTALAAFRHASAHAESTTFLALAALAAIGVALAITHLIERHGTAD